MKELTSMLPSIGNLTVHQSHLCRLECIMNTACGSWSQYQESCTLYPITLSFDTRIRLKCFHVPRSALLGPPWVRWALCKRNKSSWKCNVRYRTILNEKYMDLRTGRPTVDASSYCWNFYTFYNFYWTINYNKLIKLFIYTKCVYLNTGGIIYSIHG